MQAADFELSIDLPPSYHLGRSMSGLRMSRQDPSMRLDDRELVMAQRTQEGPVTLAARQRGAVVSVKAWGPGSAALPRTLCSLLGLDDRPDAFQPSHPRIRALQRRMIGMYLPRLPCVYDRVVQVTLLQLVTSVEGHRCWHRLVTRLGDEAPGPFGLGLGPAPRRLASVGNDDLVALGISPRQARTMRLVAVEARRLEAAAQDGPERLAALLSSLRGIGMWTTQYVLGSALGYPDAVLLGDYNLPHAVAWNLAGEPRADDARMLELLEPFGGHRYRVIRLLWGGGVRAPRRGPRHALRSRTLRPRED